MEAFCHGEINEFVQWLDTDGNIINAKQCGNNSQHRIVPTGGVGPARRPYLPQDGYMVVNSFPNTTVPSHFAFALFVRSKSCVDIAK